MAEPIRPPISYPGVYVQEVENDVHTIVPVDTSTTAFIGRAARGPINEPVICNSFGDFEANFGGLWTQSQLGYSVRDFFLNGGSKAVVVRLFHKSASASSSPTGGSKPDGAAALQVNQLTLFARSPGAWGSQLAARVSQVYPDDPKNPHKWDGLRQQVHETYGVDAAQVYNLMICDRATGAVETYANVTSAPEGKRPITSIVSQQSSLVSVPSLPEGGVLTPSLLPGDDPKKLWLDGYQITHDGDDGDDLTVGDFIVNNTKNTKTGLYALEKAGIFNLLVIPPFTPPLGSGAIPSELLAEAIAYCTERRAIMLVDPDPRWKSAQDVTNPQTGLGGLLAASGPSANAAIYFPRLVELDPLGDNQAVLYGPAGAIAGVIAQTDATRGVWKAPAGLQAPMQGVVGLSVALTDAENAMLNPLGVNCLRTMPTAGNVIWGARTTIGDDRLFSQWKYLPVRRLALFLEETLYRNTQWAGFEPNEEPLWSQLRLNIGVFMHDLFRQGAFQGASPQDAYFVRCDSTTTTQSDIDRGVVNVIVGFAPLKPAEFVVLYIQQVAGQLGA